MNSPSPQEITIEPINDGATPKLSVVIVSWNDWERLRDCLTSIYRENLPPFEVVIVDNASSDGTPGNLRRFFPTVKLYCNSRNVGHSKALNFAFGRTSGAFIVVLDQDTELLAGCVGGLIDYLERQPETDLVAPRTYNTDGTIQESARSFPSPLSGIFGRRSLLTRLFPNNPVSRRYLGRQNLDATEPFAVDQVGGACMLFRRDLLARAGYWDESYFAYWNDTEWCYRVRAAGGRIVCVPAAKIYHHETSARDHGKSSARIWMFHRNAYRMYTRWQTFGYWDPRSVLAGTALLGRALLLMGSRRLAPLLRPRGISGLLEERRARPEPSGFGGSRQ